MNRLGTRRRYAGYALVALIAVLWVGGMAVLDGAKARQDLSNTGLIVVALAAGLGALVRSRSHRGAYRRFWMLLGVGALFWSGGQAAWTWYESVLSREVPFPSVADVGYLLYPPFVIAALLSLPLSAPTVAGRLRTLLDGLMVGASLLVVSWIVVLGRIVHSDGDSFFSTLISLAYPVFDVILITLVTYVWARARQLSASGASVALRLVGTGLVAFAIADSGFVYLTTVEAYESGSLIDSGWFAGFLLVLLAAVCDDGPRESDQSQGSQSRPLGNFLPYAAVSVAILTSAIDLYRTGQPEAFVSWTRSAILLLLVGRQLLTMRENFQLASHLEHRVEERTRELRASERRFEALVQHSSDVVTVVDLDGLITYQSASSERVFGYPAESLLGRYVSDLMRPEQAQRFLAALGVAAGQPERISTLRSAWRHADGRSCAVEVTVANLLDNPDVAGLVLNARDVTERTMLEEQLTRQAFTDALTGLPNRALFRDRLQQAVARGAREKRLTVGVLFLDLDGFKEVNDTLGHSAGDELLVEVSARLRAVVRGGDTMARFGGDEFAVLIETTRGEEYDTKLARRIEKALGKPFDIGSHEVHVAASVGIAHLGPHAADAEQLLRNADLAMYCAKGTGKGGFAVYHPGMHSDLVKRVQLEKDLRRALENGELLVDYQPMFELRSGVLTGTEALVRWRHPERGIIAPDEFISVAEETGLIIPLGTWVLRESCRQLRRWSDEVGKDRVLKMSVNVSTRQLEDAAFPGLVERALSDYDIPPTSLTLEMTESVLIRDSGQTQETLRALRDLGVRMAIDDFGTGYSSLSYLHHFPVDVLKIDRSFIQRISDGGDTALVTTILRLGQAMGLETVAEGIERPQEMLMLRRQGCTTGQGYHFSPPVSADRISGYLADSDEDSEEDAVKVIGAVLGAG